MNKLIIRSLTGLIYVSIILASLFYNPILFSIVIFVFSCLAILEFQKLLNIKNILSYLFIFILFYSYLNQKLNPPESPPRYPPNSLEQPLKTPSQVP